MAEPGARPAPAGPAPIAFGTSGWRGIAGVDFTPERVARAVRAVADWLAESRAGGEVVVARDTRPGGPAYVDVAQRELRARGFAVALAPGPTPTPAAVRAAVRRGARGALVFTASHNPPEYAGMKVFGAAGEALAAEHTRRIERLAAAPPTRPGSRKPRAECREIDAVGDYATDVLRFLDREALAAAGLRIAYDAMHGAGSGVLDRVLAAAGCRVERLRAGADPDFGGAAPDPVAAHLGALCDAMRADPAPSLGLATDGDADRFAVVGEGAWILSETEALALLVDHLAATGRLARGVALSLATGSLVERVARERGLAVERHPIGFKHLAAALASGRVDAAGEESGGFALAAFGRDKDGILAGCLFAEMLAAGGPPLRRRLDALEAKHGRRRCGRIAVDHSAAAETALEGLRRQPPARVEGRPVLAAATADGLHLALDDGFLMLRGSGTEPLIRVYAEAPSEAGLARRLACGAAWLSA